MALSVADVLQLPALRGGEPEVVAGTRGLHRPVRWVHIAEVADIAYLLKGGELLLTTGLGIGQDPAVQRRYIRELAEVGAVGVVIEMGRTFTEAPPAMVEEADRHGLPLVVLHRETPYVEVTEQVHAAIINRQYDLLRKAEQIGREFTDLVLHGAGIPRIVHGLARIVENPVVLEDAAHQVVEFSTYAGSVTQVLEAWDAHSRIGHEPGPSLTPSRQDGNPTCWWTPIPLRDEIWGRLHVLVMDSPFDEIDGVALDRAAAAAGLVLLSSRDALHVANHAKGELLTDIIEGTFASPEEVYRRARALGADLEGTRLAALVVDADGFAGYVGERGLGERDVHRVKMALLSQTREAIAEAGCAAISAVQRDEVLAVVGIPPHLDPREALDRIGERIGERLSGVLQGLSVTVGASRTVPAVDGLPRAFDEARKAVSYGQATAVRRHTYHYDEMGLHRILLRLEDQAELSRFVESELGPLLEHDARSAVPLVPTLRAFLERGANKSAAARALHLERRSLYHRLERISRILDCDLDEMEVRARLLLALRALELVRRPPGSPLPARPGR